MSSSIDGKVSSGLSLMSAAIWLEQAIVFGVFVIFARLLGAETVGVAMMAIAVVLLGETLVRETLGDFLIQHRDLEAGHLSAAFWMAVALAAAVIALIWVAAPAIAGVYGEPQVMDLLRTSSVSILFVAIAAVPVARLRRRLAFKGLAIRTVAGPLAGGVAGVAAALAGWQAWSLVVQRIVQSITTDGLVWLTESWRPDLSARRRHILDVWRFSSRMVGLRAATLLTVQTPMYVTGVMFGPAALALYTAAWRLVDAVSFLIAAPLRFVAQPAFAALRRGEAADAAMLRTFSSTAGLLAFPTFAGLAAVAPTLLVVLFGDEWNLAGSVTRVLAVVGLYVTLERINEAYCLAMGRATAMLGYAAAELALGVALIVAAAPFGSGAIAAAVAVRALMIWPARASYVTRLAGVRLSGYVLDFAAPAVLAGAMGLAVWLWRSGFAVNLPPMADLATSVALGIALYTGLAVVLMRRRLLQTVSLVTHSRRPAVAARSAQGSPGA